MSATDLKRVYFANFEKTFLGMSTSGGQYVEIELARLVIRSLLVPYLSFSSTLMLSSMHHIDTHIF